MSNPNTPVEPQGTGPVPGEPLSAPFLPQPPYAQPGGYPQPPFQGQGQGQPPQPNYSTQPQSPQPYPMFSPQQPAPALPVQQRQPRQPRQPRPKTDPNGVPYGVGPFTLREAVFLGATALVLLGSLLPFLSGDYADVFGYASAWAPAGWLVIPAALVLVAAAFLIVVRRIFGVRRLAVGSLSVDQFASAASVVTAGFYVGALFLIAGFPAWFGGGSDILEPGAGVFVGLVFSLVAVAVTTLAPGLPVLGEEFASRQETSAHPVARPASAVPRRPRAERTEAAAEQPAAHPGMPMQQARPGQFAAYKRKGSQPAPLPADDHAAPFSAAPAAAAPVGAVVYQPGTSPSQQPVDGPAAGTVDASAEHRAVEQPSAGPDEATRALPTAPADEPRAVSPGFVATDVPAVDPQPVGAVPFTEYTDEDFDDEDRSDVTIEGARNDGPAPLSALGHVSARTATGPAADSSGLIQEQPTAVFSTQPFWVYSPVPRPVVDEASGATVFEIGPSAWALAIMDRGSELVLRHDDGRVGVLRNLEGITRG